MTFPRRAFLRVKTCLEVERIFNFWLELPSCSSFLTSTLKTRLSQYTHTHYHCKWIGHHQKQSQKHPIHFSLCTLSSFALQTSKGHQLMVRQGRMERMDALATDRCCWVSGYNIKQTVRSKGIHMGIFDITRCETQKRQHLLVCK